MGLTLSGSTDKINHGSDASLDDLTTWSVLMWVRPSASIATSDQLFRKEATGRKQVAVYFSGVTQLFGQVHRASGGDDFTTATGVVVTNTWQCYGITYSGSADPRFHVYRGTRLVDLAEVSYVARTSTGSGVSTDATGDLIVGNRASDGVPFDGDISTFMQWNATLSLADLINQQYNIWYPVISSSCITFTNYGHNGVAQQSDWSSAGNHGAVTGATVVPHVPLPRFLIQSVPAVAVAGGLSIPVAMHHYQQQRQVG